MATHYWVTNDNLGSLATEDAGYNPGTGWHTATLAQYNAVVAAVPNPRHTDVHAFITILNTVRKTTAQPVLTAAQEGVIHRLFGQIYP